MHHHHQARLRPLRHRSHHQQRNQDRQDREAGLGRGQPSTLSVRCGSKLSLAMGTLDAVRGHQEAPLAARVGPLLKDFGINRLGKIVKADRLRRNGDRSFEIVSTTIVASPKKSLNQLDRSNLAAGSHEITSQSQPRVNLTNLLYAIGKPSENRLGLTKNPIRRRTTSAQ
jgi:hypothetical protein